MSTVVVGNSDTSQKVLNFIKVAGILLGGFVIISILIAFEKSTSSAGFSDLSKTFGSITGALAFLSSYWYLFLGAFLVGPFVSQAGKYAANKLSDASKSGLKGDDLSAVADLITHQQALDALSQTQDPAEREKLEQQRDNAADSFRDKSEEAKDKANDWAKKSNVTPIE